MNARGIAQEVVNWYLENLDPYKPHPKNAPILRGPVLGLTVYVLKSPGSPLPEKVSEEKATGEVSNASGKKVDGNTLAALGWKSFIRTPTAAAESDGAEAAILERERLAYESLGRRSEARMEAFLASLEFAAPVDVAEEETDTQTDKQAQTPSTSSSPAKEAKSAMKDTTTPPKPSPIIPATSALPKSNAKESNNKTNTPTSRKSGQAFLKQMSSSAHKFVAVKYRQVPEAELLTRFELYIRSLHRVKTRDNNCVIALEPARAIKARADFIVKDFGASVGSVQNLHPLLTKLLTLLTKELLAVHILGDELVKVIRRLVNEYEHSTSFASLAFLSSPEVSAETVLPPLILKYLKYLQSDWENLVASCELELMLVRSLDPNVRHLFKTIEFQSIGHLLEVCQYYRTELRNIELPPNTDDNEDKYSRELMTQAIRDLQREVITVNGHILPPVTSRHDLVHLLSQTLNSRSVASIPVKKKRASKSKTKEGAKNMERSDSCPETSTDGGDYISSSGYEEDSEPEKRKGKSLHRRRFHLSTVDMLTKRLLVTASRTGLGGDAYFVVRDLFGGDGVEVVPSKALSTYFGGYRSGSIEISVRLSGVTIKCNGSFDVYPKSLVGLCEPLIQLHTTTSETIHLQELRANDSCDEDGKPKKADDTSDDDNDKEWGHRNVMIVQERVTPKTGWRTLSIRPALYEKVQEWDTPS